MDKQARSTTAPSEIEECAAQKKSPFVTGLGTSFDIDIPILGTGVSEKTRPAA